MLRQKRQVTLRFPREAAVHLVDGGSRRRPGSLVVHVGSRRMSARWTPLPGMDNPPAFRGVIEHDPNGFTVEGAIRETRAMAAMPAGFALVGGCGIGMAVAGPPGGDRALFVGVGVALALLFGVLLLISLRRRRPRFRRQAGDLEHGIDTYLRTGEVQRPVPR